MKYVELTRPRSAKMTRPHSTARNEKATKQSRRCCADPIRIRAFSVLSYQACSAWAHQQVLLVHTIIACQWRTAARRVAWLFMSIGAVLHWKERMGRLALAKYNILYDICVDRRK